MERDLPPATARAVPFAPVLWPAALAAWARVEERCGRSLARIADAARDDLRAAVLARLSEVAAPTLAELLDGDLSYGTRLMTRLAPEPADAPRERYARFCLHVLDRGLEAALRDHPVLGGLVELAASQWVGAASELLLRLERDRIVLAERLGVPADAMVSGVLSAGDTHNGGRAVAVLAFGSTRVVYKPRDCRLEALYGEVVSRVSAADPGQALLAPQVVPRADDGGRYGWAEHLAWLPCGDRAELRRFYRNAGRTLALLHALSATDCHAENLVAHRDQLVLVDGETLMEPAAPAGLRPPGRPEPDAVASVLRVGLLPTWLWLSGPGEAVDMSALGAGTGPVARTGWRAVNTDAMCRGPVAAAGSWPASLPVPPGTANPLLQNAEELVAGFEAMYDLLASPVGVEVAEMLESAGALSRRVVIRPTSVYATVLAESLDPTEVQSADSRAGVLEQLTRAYRSEEVAPYLPVAVAEQEALAALDVPYFESSLDAGGLRWHPDGALDGWPPAGAAAAAGARLRSLDDRDRRWQAALVRSALAASGLRMSDMRGTAGGPGGATPAGPAPAEQPPRPPELGAVLAAAVDVVERAGAGADGDDTWMSLTLLPDGERLNLQPIGPGLYDGRMGLAVALYEAARLVPPERRRAVRSAADRALAPLGRVLDDPDASRRMATVIGPGMHGVGGLLRGLEWLTATGDADPDTLRRRVGHLVAGVPVEALSGDRVLDHIGGAAGLLAPLARLLSASGDARAERLLRAGADVLLRRQDPVTGGWPSRSAASAPLTGLAHGAAGIALALAEAGVALDNAALVDAAARGIAYEDSTFDEREGNWPDYRAGVGTSASDAGFMLGWCAGAPGIALTRARLLELLPEHDMADGWRLSLVAGASRAAASTLPARDHLCCGTLGIVTILRALAHHSERGDWSAAADRLAAGVLARSGEDLPRSILGAPDVGLPVPGLMTGLPGAWLGLASTDPRPWVTRLLL